MSGRVPRAYIGMASGHPQLLLPLIGLWFHQQTILWRVDENSGKGGARPLNIEGVVGVVGIDQEDCFTLRRVKESCTKCIAVSVPGYLSCGKLY